MMLGLYHVLPLFMHNFASAGLSGSVILEKFFSSEDNCGSAQGLITRLVDFA
jgi:hypothetical protein